MPTPDPESFSPERTCDFWRVTWGWFFMKGGVSDQGSRRAPSPSFPHSPLRREEQCRLRSTWWVRPLGLCPLPRPQIIFHTPGTWGPLKWASLPKPGPQEGPAFPPIPWRARVTLYWIFPLSLLVGELRGGAEAPSVTLGVLDSFSESLFPPHPAGPSLNRAFQPRDVLLLCFQLCSSALGA